MLNKIKTLLKKRRGRVGRGRGSSSGDECIEGIFTTQRPRFGTLEETYEWILADMKETFKNRQILEDIVNSHTTQGVDWTE